jgi:hypothetical protein
MKIPGSYRLTPLGEGGVAVLAVPRAEAEAWLLSQGVKEAPPPGEIRLVRLRPFLGESSNATSKASGPEIEALLVGTPDEEWVELHLPGTPFLIKNLAEREWTFSDRGLFLGVSSFLERECLEVAQRAPTSRGAELALSQMSPGSWMSLVKDADRASMGDPSFLAKLRLAWDNGGKFEGLLRPTWISLRGKTNAGKSTLFNLLLGAERVRTGPQAGLTLDPVNESIEGLGWPFVLVDTAGEGESQEGLERQAMLLGRELSSGSLVVEVRSLVGNGEGVEDEGGIKNPAFCFFTHAVARPETQKKTNPDRDQGLPREGTLRFDLKMENPDEVRLAFFNKVLAVLGRDAFPEASGCSCLLTLRQKALVGKILDAKDEKLRWGALQQLKGGFS